MKKTFSAVQRGILTAMLLSLFSCSSPRSYHHDDTFFTPYTDKTLSREQSAEYYSLGTRKNVAHQISFVEQLLPRLVQQSTSITLLENLLLVAEGKREEQKESDTLLLFSRVRPKNKSLEYSYHEILSVLDEQNTHLQSLRAQLQILLQKRETPHLIVAKVDARPIETNNVYRSDTMVTYDNAIRLYYARQYTKANTILQSLLAKGVPDSVADNCHFWSGVCHFQLGAIQNAITAFVAVMKYPTSDKYESALFMLGQCYERLARPELAHATFRMLLRKFPHTTLRSVTEQKLIALR